MDDQPSRGDLAVCKNGIVGVITRIDGKKCYGVDVDEFLKDE